MEPTGQNIDYAALRQALMARAGRPGMGQAPATPALAQVGTPVGTNPLSGGVPTLTRPTTQLQRPPSATPRFSSPFAGPGAGVGNRFDDETKKIGKALIAKLLTVL